MHIMDIFCFLITDGAGFPHLIAGLTMNQWSQTGESAFPLNLSENHGIVSAETNRVYLSINKTSILWILLSRVESPLRSQNVTDPEQPEEDEEVEGPMLLPPPDYSDSSRDRPIKPSTPSLQNTVNTALANGKTKCKVSWKSSHFL